MKKETNLKNFIQDFDNMKKAQNILHFTFVVYLLAYIIMQSLNILSDNQQLLTEIFLITFALWLMFTNLYKQNQAYRLLKKHYKNKINKL